MPKPRKPSPALRAHAQVIGKRLAQAIPHPHIELLFKSPWQLLIAVMLAAQNTDRNVNRVMPELLARWPTPHALAAADLGEVETIIKSTGFFRVKAKAIRAASQMLVERFGGEVPRSLERMLEIPGVARKTANVVLGTALGVRAGIVVDTHGTRVSQRLGLTRHTDPEKIEAALCALFPPEQWILIGHRFTLHGRHVCTAREPRCEVCPLNELCPKRQAPPRGSAAKRAESEQLEMDGRSDGFASAVGSAT